MNILLVCSQRNNSKNLPILQQLMHEYAYQGHTVQTFTQKASFSVIKRKIATFNPEIVHVFDNLFSAYLFLTPFIARRTRVCFSVPRITGWLSIVQLMVLWPLLITVLRSIRVIHVTALDHSFSTRIIKRILNKRLYVQQWGVDTSDDVKPIAFDKETVRIVSVTSQTGAGMQWLIDLLEDIAHIVRVHFDVTFISRTQKIEANNNVDIRFLTDPSDTEIYRQFNSTHIFFQLSDEVCHERFVPIALSKGVLVVKHNTGLTEYVYRTCTMRIDPYNKAQTKVVFCKLIEDKAFRTQLIDAGYDCIKQNFSWSVVAERFLHKYNHA